MYVLAAEGSQTGGLSPISLGAGGMSFRLTALPLWVTEFQVLAGASRILAGAIRASDAFDLVIQ